MKNGSKYRASLKKLGSNLHKWGKPIKDVTRHPATSLHVAAIAACYDAAFDPAKADGETRARLARLLEWLTVGGGIPGCLHGGGSPDGARLVVRALEPWQSFAGHARSIAGVGGK